MINVIICEDNIKDKNKTIKIVKEFFKTRKMEYKIHLYSDYNENFYKIIKSPISFKIYLLDIETPSKSGIDVARDIRKNDVESVILFLTAHEELGSIIINENLMILSFINKFNNFENRLSLSLLEALKFINKKQIIKIKDKNICYDINISNILYITKDSFERKTIIKTDNNEIKISKSLTEVRKMLDDRFIQTHRACYINKDRKYKIDFKNKIITFDNNETIDLISDKYKKELG